MRAIRIYKDNLREHIFRTLFFTDTVVFFGIALILAGATTAIYLSVLHIYQAGLIISSIFLIEIVFALIATLKVEKQPLFKIIPRTFSYSLSKKQFSKQQIAKTTGNFKIIGNNIIYKNKLLAICEIHPFDTALLNDEERERFYHHIKTMLHTLPSNIQLILRKEKAKVTDYNSHFYSLYETANKNLDWLLKRYIIEMSSLIELNEFQIMKYYAIFSTPLVSEKDTDLTFAVQKIQDIEKRFSSTLALEKIFTTQLTKMELITYFKVQFQNNL